MKEAVWRRGKGETWQKYRHTHMQHACREERPEKRPSLHPISTPVNIEPDGLDGPNKTAGQQAAGWFHETEILTSCPGRLVPKSRERQSRTVICLVEGILAKSQNDWSGFRATR